MKNLLKRSRQEPPPGAEELLNVAALTAVQLAMILAAAGGRISAADIAHDLAAGAPQNADGTLNLIHYTAWLASLAD